MTDTKEGNVQECADGRWRGRPSLLLKGRHTTLRRFAHLRPRSPDDLPPLVCLVSDCLSWILFSQPAIPSITYLSLPFLVYLVSACLSQCAFSHVHFNSLHVFCLILPAPGRLCAACVPLKVSLLASLVINLPPYSCEVSVYCD